MEQQALSQGDLVVDDLARQVAVKTLEAASWRARALAAEAALEELRQAAEADGPEQPDESANAEEG